MSREDAFEIGENANNCKEEKMFPVINFTNFTNFFNEIMLI